VHVQDIGDTVGSRHTDVLTAPAYPRTANAERQTLNVLDFILLTVENRSQSRIPL